MISEFSARNKILKIHSVLMVAAIVIFFLIYLSLFSSERNKKVYVIFRYDDFTSGSSFSVEKEIIHAIDKYGISCSFGVIPFSGDTNNRNITRLMPLSKDKIELIRNYVQKGSIEICQHGYLHKLVNSSEPYSEFLKLPYIDQYKRISAGKRNLDSTFSIDIKTFIPPWNTYDQNTLKSLIKLGFSHISADNLGTTNELLPIDYVPYTTTISELESCLNYKRLPFSNNTAVTVLMLHDYDFSEINEENGITNSVDFGKTIERLMKNEWKIVSIWDAAQDIDNFDHNHYQFNKLKLLLLDNLSSLHYFGKIFGKINVLKTFYISDYLIVKLIIMVSIYYLIIALVVSAFILYVANKLNLGILYSVILGIIDIILMVTFTFYFLYDDNVLGKHELLLLIAGFGLLSGLINNYMLQKKRPTSS